MNAVNSGPRIFAFHSKCPGNAGRSDLDLLGEKDHVSWLNYCAWSAEEVVGRGQGAWGKAPIELI